MDVAPAKHIDAGIYGMGIASGDSDADLDLDYYVTNAGANTFHRQDSNGFQDIADTLGVSNKLVDPTGADTSTITFGWGTAFADLDNDLDLDLLVANGFMNFALAPTQVTDTNRLYLNDGTGQFPQEVAVASGFGSAGVSRGLAVGDYDLDGDVDIAVVEDSLETGNVLLPGKLRLYRNETATNHHWLSVRLRGLKANRDGIGAHIRCHVGARSWVHEVSSGGSFMSQNSLRAHFGLGDSTQVDSLRITWPGGNTQLLTNLPADTHLTVVEDTGQAPLDTSLSVSACDSFVFHGDTLFSGGQFSDTLLAANGLDSIITLNLTLNRSSSAQIDTSLGAGGVTIAGTTYDSSGTFHDTLTNAAGCDSLLRIVIQEITGRDTPLAGLRLFPNPTRGELQLQWVPGQVRAATLHSKTGRRLRAWRFGEGQSAASLQLRELPAGMYLLRLRGPAGVAHRRILKH